MNQKHLWTYFQSCLYFQLLGRNGGLGVIVTFRVAVVPLPLSISTQGREIVEQFEDVHKRERSCPSGSNTEDEEEPCQVGEGGCCKGTFLTTIILITTYDT